MRLNISEELGFIFLSGYIHKHLEKGLSLKCLAWYETINVPLSMLYSCPIAGWCSFLRLISAGATQEVDVTRVSRLDINCHNA